MGFVFRGLRGVPFVPYEGERVRCTARDFHSLAMAARLYIACTGKLTELVIESRVRKIPGAWRDWKSGMAFMGRAMNAALNTVPDDQFDRISTIINEGTLEISLPKASINQQGGTVMAVEGRALQCLIYYAMRNECAICLKSGGEAKRCELYGALKGCTEPDTWETYGCPWRDLITETLRLEREEAAKAGKGKKR